VAGPTQTTGISPLTIVRLETTIQVNLAEPETGKDGTAAADCDEFYRITPCFEMQTSPSL